MRRLLIGALTAGVVFAAVGCDVPIPKRNPATEPTQPIPAGGGGGGGIPGAGGAVQNPGGAAQAVRGAVQRTVTAAELKDLHLFIDTYSLSSGKMPTAPEITAAVQKENKKLHELLADGTIVLTGSTVRESCWAYQKDAATNGGWIITHSGPERVDAATAKRWITGQ